MNQMLADIALPVPLDRTFTYLVPPELSSTLQLGQRVLVPFGRKKLSGVVVGFPKASSFPSLKPVIDVLDATPAFSEEMLKLTRWISEYYLAPWGDVLKAATPLGSGTASTQFVRLAAANVGELLEQTKRSARIQHAILQALAGSEKLNTAQLQKKARVRSIHAVLHDMQERGWITLEEKLRISAKPKSENVVILTHEGRAFLERSVGDDSGQSKATPKQRRVLDELRHLDEPIPTSRLIRLADTSLSIIQTLARKNLLIIERREVLRGTNAEMPETPPCLILNPHQQRALDTVAASLAAGAHKTFLLHGITGSGKTQVYIEAIRFAIQRGMNAIVLVPEISLTPQTVRRFKSHFGNEVAVMHSQMSAGERYDAWRLAHEGRVKIVIGPRSAIFAPLKNIGLIVVDEEHEAWYKQYDATPRYHARDVAIVRSLLAKAVVILGSATPSAESYHNALKGKYSF